MNRASEVVTMGLDNDAVKALYERPVRIPLFWEVGAFFSRATENSIYRKQAIAALGLTADSLALDAACGTGLTKRFGQRYLDYRARTHALWPGSALARRRDQRCVK